MLHDKLSREILQDLQKGYTINLYGDENHGIKNIVENIRILTSGHANVKVLDINMRSFATSFEGFLGSIATGLNIEKKPNWKTAELVNFWLDKNKKSNNPTSLFLCLTNFDRLHDTETDKSYDIAFLDFLNGLKNQDYVSLLLTSSSKLKDKDIYIAGKPITGSKIDVSKAWPMPNLTPHDVEAYLKYDAIQEVKDYFSANKTDAMLIVGKICKNKSPLEFADFVRIQLRDCSTLTTKELEELMDKWEKQFSKSKFSAGHQLTKLNRWGRMTQGNVMQLFSFVTRLNKTTKVILAIAAILVGIFISFKDFILSHIPF